MTHTPGKWSSWSNGEVRVIRDENGARICQMIYLNSNGRRPDEEVKANAFLVAAAPDLLAASRLALSRLDYHMGDTDPASDNVDMIACQALAAAIDRATPK